MRRKKWARCQAGLLAATAALILQYPAYAGPVGQEFLATPSEAVESLWGDGCRKWGDFSWRSARA